MITAEKVKALNKKIEELNAKSTKAKAKVEVLEGNLNKSLDDYQAIYGVSLRGKSMAETISNIKAELDAVGNEAEKEFELRNAVVDAIERGDIEEANRLLGVDVAESEDEELAPEEENAPEDNAPAEVVESPVEEYSEDWEDEDDDFDLSGIDLEEDEPIHDSVENTKKSGNSFVNLGSSVEDTVSDLDDDSFGDFNLSDEDFNEFDDFGLGVMLTGTKFEID